MSLVEDLSRSLADRSSKQDLDSLTRHKVVVFFFFPPHLLGWDFGFLVGGNTRFESLHLIKLRVPDVAAIQKLLAETYHGC